MAEKSRPVPGKFWFFTWNNYPEDVVEILLETFDECVKYVFQKEIGEKCGTPHIQGCIEHSKKIRPIEYFGLPNKINWSKTRNREKAAKYCSKELTRTSDEVWSRGFKFRKPIKVIEPSGWQLDLLEIVKTEPDDRSILWYWSEEGSVGKSSMCKYLCVKHGAIVLSGKCADMKYGIIKYMEKHGDYPELVLIDVPRSCADYISYTGIEEIKNGCFFSSKYEGDMVLGNSPHLVVFSNQEPKWSAMSEDRWIVKKID